MQRSLWTYVFGIVVSLTISVSCGGTKSSSTPTTPTEGSSSCTTSKTKFSGTRFSSPVPSEIPVRVDVHDGRITATFDLPSQFISYSSDFFVNAGVDLFSRSSGKSFRFDWGSPDSQEPRRVINNSIERPWKVEIGPSDSLDQLVPSTAQVSISPGTMRLQVSLSSAVEDLGGLGRDFVWSAHIDSVLLPSVSNGGVGYGGSAASSCGVKADGTGPEIKFESSGTTSPNGSAEKAITVSTESLSPMRFMSNEEASTSCRILLGAHAIWPQPRNPGEPNSSSGDAGETWEGFLRVGASGDTLFADTSDPWTGGPRISWPVYGVLRAGETTVKRVDAPDTWHPEKGLIGKGEDPIPSSILVSTNENGIITKCTVNQMMELP